MLLRFLLLLAALSVTPAVAQVNAPATPRQSLLPVASPVVQTENVRAELVSEVATVKPGEPFWVGLHQTIRPKWHTYWRNPGDSGMPTTLAWTLPLGAGASEIVWPLPERFRLGPVINYGYHNDVLLPVQITPPATLQPGETFTFAADATWLVCEEVCIPEEGRVTLTLPVASTVQPGEPATRQRFEATRRAVPIASPWEAHYVARDAKRLTLTVRAAGLKRDTIADAYFYPLPMSPVEHTPDQAFAISSGALTLELARSAAAPNLPQELSGVLVIRERTGAGEATQAFELTAALDGSGGTAASRVPLPGTGSGTLVAGAGEEIGFWQALLFALIGGLILNLMPCVFPVLSMKALALAQHARAERWPQRAHGLAYTAGVLASFAAIGALIAGLRVGGESLGWGFQFQSPLFTLLIAWLFFVIGLNLSGLFEIGGRIAGVGAGLAARTGYGGSFFTGVLATVVATPCTAPFMAAAVGFALAQPASLSVAVLLAMGLGLALPFLLLSFSPALLRVLPSPGTWMVRFRQMLAFPMYASAAWLVWVLAQQAGNDGVLYALCGMVLLGFAFWLWQALREAGSAGWRVVAAGAMAASLAGAIALAISIGSAAPSYATSTAAPSADENWERFSRARLAELRAEGKPVFVNFTAAWCITCLANERVALSTDAVKRAFAERGVVYLKGDWTNRDPEITATLKEFGRAGVPLYLWYAGPADRPATVLPQILTEAEILAQIGR
jgi:thiol:disulfide interchange protein/DsbC/DsbD-like thiol-disulfide interchange protein